MDVLITKALEVLAGSEGGNSNLIIALVLLAFAWVILGLKKAVKELTVAVGIISTFATKEELAKIDMRLTVLENLCEERHNHK
jgi:hypothetical protein